MLHTIINRFNLTYGAYILRFSREGFEFWPGQNLRISLPDEQWYREYSVYSSVYDDYIDVLIREVENGNLSKKLRIASIGSQIDVRGPIGHFLQEIDNSFPIFIATGTGIAPFHSYILSYKPKEYLLFHGIRHLDEQYQSETYNGHYIPCVTKGKYDGIFQGRVTDKLKKSKCYIMENAKYFLCGRNEMVQEVFNILTKEGVKEERIFGEIYF